MKKYAKILIASFLSLGTLNALACITKKSELQPAEAAAHTANFDEYTYDGDYYSFLPSNYTDGKDGTLRTSLSSNILPKSWPTYGSAGETHLSTLCQYADEDPTNSANMIYLYTRDSKKKNAASDWNREHVWPQSLSNGNWGTTNAGTDVLHLRPTYNSTNSKRGNDKYGYVSGSWLEYNGMEYCKSGNGKFEPLDTVKGDVARIIMYVWVAYKNYYTNMPEITNVFESYNTLLEWHALDKPDAMEGHRNDYTEKESMQKNRNPFVDHPEYAWEIFGDNVSSSVLDACKEAYPAGGSTTIPTYINLSANPTSIAVGETTSISISSDGSKSVNWSTNNSSVATVNNGVVTGVGQGTATITATSKLDNSVKGTINISVKSVTSLTKQGTLAKTTYKAGTAFDYTGLTITAVYSDSSTRDVTNLVTWSPAKLTEGTTEVVGSYGGKTITITGITVEAKTGSGDGLKIIWGNSGSDASSEMSATTLMSYTTEGADSIDSYTDLSKAYKGSTGIKLGSGSAVGKFTINLKDTVTATSIVANIKQYGTSGDGGSVKITTDAGEDFVKPGSDFEDKTFDIDGDISTITVATTSKRAYISSLELVSGGTTPTKTLSSITATGAKTSFNVGDTFSFGGTVTANYSDGTSANVTSSATFSGYNMSTAGNQTVTVTYVEGSDTKTTTYNITITAPKTLSSITLSGQTTTFTVGDTFAFGGTVTAHYSDGTTANVTSSATFSGYNMSATGTQTVTVTYEGKTATYSITVNAGGSSAFTGLVQNGQYYIKHASYYMKSNGTTKVPDAVTNKADATLFTFTLVADNTYTIKSGSDYLYTTVANNGLRVGSTEMNWIIDEGSLATGAYDIYETSAVESGKTGRWLTLYNNADFRTYNTVNATNRKESTDLEKPGATPTKTLTGISLSDQTTEFTVGNTFSFGGTVTATYDDSSTADVTANVTFSEVDLSTTGTKEVTVTYTEGGVTKTAKYSITVSNSSSGDTTYTMYSGEITEGKYIICSGTTAMVNSISSDRFSYTTVTPSNNKITNPDASIIWEISKSGDYYTIFSADANAYAASTGVKNKAALNSSGTDNKSLWTVTGDSTYDFTNKENTAKSVNATLRLNGTYGFACYATDTGKALTLYKLDSGTTPTKTLSSIAISGQTTELNVGATFVFGGTVTATYDDSSTANVTNKATFSGANMSVAGTYTITVSYTEGSVTRTTTYTLTVKSVAPDHGTTASDPLTVSEARDIIDAGTAGTTVYYVKGVVKSIASEWSTTYKNVSFYMLDEGCSDKNSTADFEAYRASASAGVDGPSIKAGDTVLVFGQLTKYKSTYETTEKTGFIAEVTTLEEKAAAYASDFNNANVCGTSNLTPAIGSVWTSMSQAYGELDVFTQEYLTAVNLSAETNASIVECITRYDRVQELYGGNSFANFMNRTYSSASRNTQSIDSNAAVVILAMVAVSFIGFAGILALRKKKFEK